MFLAIMGTGITVIAALSQQPAFLKASGLSAHDAALILGLSATGSFFGAATIGWLLDRYPGWVSALIVSLGMFGGLTTLYLLLSIPSFPIAVTGGFLLGYGVGAAEVLWMTFVKRQFGEAAFPYTFGGWSFALQAGYALGGSISGWGLQTFGQTGLLILIALFYLPGAIVSFTLPAARASISVPDRSRKPQAT
jgi:MFS family permease